MIKIKTYKIFSVLLLYPEIELFNSLDDIIKELKNENLLLSIDIKKLFLFVNYLKSNDILFLQEKYVSIFDKQKYFSLYLFEHIHGDSRERGMAMVDLKDLYRKSKFDIDSNLELPDFLPVFLEFLSTCSKSRAENLLGEVINIISVISFRLKIIKSPYYFVFSILESLSNKKTDKLFVRKTVKKEKILKSLDVDFDKTWEEPKVF